MRLRRHARTVDRHAAMRSRTEAEPLAGAPISQIVLRARRIAARMIGNLIRRKAGRIAQLLRDLVERRAILRVWRTHRATPDREIERRALFNGELIEREMLCRQRERFTQLRAPLLRRLVLARIDQIDRDARAR